MMQADRFGGGCKLVFGFENPKTGRAAAAQAREKAARLSADQIKRQADRWEKFLRRSSQIIAGGPVQESAKRSELIKSVREFDV